MCGIAGVFSLTEGSPAADRSLLERMSGALAHRGPDGSGLWVSPDGMTGFAHRRLAITDLTPAAAQPFSNEDGSIVVVFNGEIYNHAEVRRELSTRDHVWKTDHSDTEVLVHGYEEWGLGFLDRLRGMFAFALWDGREKRLFLFRDRLGIKPLYWTTHRGRLLFASEIKALLEEPSLPRAIDEEAFFDYLSFLTAPAPRTLFQGIEKLEAGSYIEARADGSIRRERYWHPFRGVAKDHRRSDGEWAEAILAELTESVRLHSLADVPVGIFLSGGIDSSTNAALFAQAMGAQAMPGGRIESFSIGYGGTRGYPDEHEFARLAARHVGARHHELNLTLKDLLGFLPAMVEHQDEPIADPVCFPVHFISRFAREHGMKVCQVGEGSDELFFGYPAWRTALRLQKLDGLPVPRALKRCGLGLLDLIGRRDTLGREWLRRGSEGERVFWGGAEAFTEPAKRALLSPRMREKFAGRSSYEPIGRLFLRYLEDAPDFSDLDWMTYLDLSFRLPELLLMRVDKMGMAASLEARVPFLDHHLVSLVLSIPERARTRGGNLKPLLKRAVRDLLPPEILKRPKQGFGVPIAQWLLEGLGERAREPILAFAAATDLIDRAEVERLLVRRDERVWYLLNVAMWWERFVK